MKKAPKRLKQKSLLGYFGSSSPPQPQAGPSRQPPPSPESPLCKRAPPKQRAQAKRRAGDSYPPSDAGSRSTSSDVAGIDFEPEVVEVSSDEDAEQSPRRPTATQRGTRKMRADSAERALIVSSDAEEDEDYVMPITWKGRPKDVKGKRKRAVVDSDSDEPVQRTSKLIKGIRPPTPEDNDEDLANEVDEESP